VAQLGAALQISVRLPFRLTADGMAGTPRRVAHCPVAIGPPYSRHLMAVAGWSKGALQSHSLHARQVFGSPVKLSHSALSRHPHHRHTHVHTGDKLNIAFSWEDTRPRPPSSTRGPPAPAPPPPPHTMALLSLSRSLSLSLLSLSLSSLSLFYPLPPFFLSLSLSRSLERTGTSRLTRPTPLQDGPHPNGGRSQLRHSSAAPRQPPQRRRRRRRCRPHRYSRLRPS
jgi:hypothetical protein